MVAFNFRSTASSLAALVALAIGSDATAERRDDWPCASCIFETPAGYDPSTPAPLLVTFHGDYASIDYIHRGVQDNAEQHGFLVASLRCPTALGCGDSWWQWEDSFGYDESFAGEQIDAIAAAYAVARDQIYLVGFSGGSSYLSDYLLDHSDRYAGGLFLGGGNPRSRCSACPIPVWFVIGDQDFLLDGAVATRDAWESCGNEVDFDLFPGVDHQIIEEPLPAIFGEMAARTHPCMASPPSSDPDAGPGPRPPDGGGAGDRDAGHDGDPPASADGNLVGGCSLAAHRPGAGWPLLIALGVLWRRRVRTA